MDYGGRMAPTTIMLNGTRHVVVPAQTSDSRDSLVPIHEFLTDGSVAVHGKDSGIVVARFTRDDRHVAVLDRGRDSHRYVVVQFDDLRPA